METVQDPIPGRMGIYERREHDPEDIVIDPETGKPIKLLPPIDPRRPSGGMVSA